ncbi:MAG: hypothetical protein HKP42_07510 [Maribacter sp.]|nr:hypothetical protein [Maribacter sp.]
MKKIFIILITLILAGCFPDVVTNDYETYEKAVAGKLFERGWLPNNLPKSTMNIKVKNNLDLNTSTGEFYIDLEELNSFISQLEHMKNHSNGNSQYKYSSGVSLWTFTVDPRNGHVRYVLH